MDRRSISAKVAVAAAACFALVLQLVSPASAAGPPARIDCTNPDVNAFDRPEHAYRPSSFGAESNAPFTCTVTDSANQLVGAGVTVRGEATTETGSVNDPDDGASFASPDYSCTTGAGSTCVVTVTQSENQVGTSTICFYLNVSTAATHCANESALHDGDVNAADEVIVTWETRDPGKGGLDVEPETAVAPRGGKHAVGATIYDQFGYEWVGQRTVHFELYAGSPSDTDESTSLNTPDRTCVTSASASCSVTFSSNTLGRDLLCVWTNRTPTISGSNNQTPCAGRAPWDDPGVFDAPDIPTANHDGVEIWWQEPDLIGGGLDAEPELALVRTGKKHVVSIKVHDDEGAPRPGAVVFFEFSRGSLSLDEPNVHLVDPDGRCVTSSAGVCSFAYKQIDTGNDWICIWLNGYPVIASTPGQTPDHWTCGGEGLTDVDDQPGVFDDPAPLDGDVDFIKVRWAKPKGG